MLILVGEGEGWTWKKQTCYVIYSDAAGLSVHTSGKPASGPSLYKTASVQSKAGYVEGGTVGHTDDKDVSYEFNIKGYSLLSLKSNKIQIKNKLFELFWALFYFCFEGGRGGREGGGGVRGKTPVLWVISQGSLSNFVGFLLVMTLNPCKLCGLSDASRYFHQNSTRASSEARDDEWASVFGSGFIRY